ncbi:unnamed protein product [Linum tenue]|uniref:Plectin/eS10 N-terminal domain-containing protein n=1 Tax=Linum tenue TaxID=586396 RepID=A0AAV0K5I7_9ROSI|nr:unnamed protein product [Linum tenue]CAI0417115.1 unnamed protein product [Linum tenue]
MIISEKNRREISKYLFQEGVCFAKKDFNLAKHPEIDVPNLQVIKLMQSFKSKEYVHGERRFGGDRDGYRAGPRAPGGDFGDKGGAPADYKPTYGGGSSGPRTGFGRGAGGYGGGAGASSNLP